MNNLLISDVYFHKLHPGTNSRYLWTAHCMAGQESISAFLMGQHKTYVN